MTLVTRTSAAGCRLRATRGYANPQGAIARHELKMDAPPVTLHAATGADLAFARRIYLETMRYVTDRLPDFDEARHVARFAERFLPEEVSIVVCGCQDVGWLQVQEGTEAILLKQIYLEPTFQGRGIGSRLLLDLADRARRAQKPLKLGVVKINRAVRLYRRLGFAVTAEDACKYYMQKDPGA